MAGPVGEEGPVSRPVGSEPLGIGPIKDPAGRGPRLSGHLKSLISVPVDGQRDNALPGGCLARIEIHHLLEPDEPALGMGDTRHCMFAGCDGGGLGQMSASVGTDLDTGPGFVDPACHRAADHVCTGLRSLVEQAFIQPVSGQSRGGERQMGFLRTVSADDLQVPDRYRAEGKSIDLEVVQERERIAAQEVAADLVVRPARLFDQEHVKAVTRQLDGKGASGRSTPDNNRITMLQFTHTCTFASPKILYSRRGKSYNVKTCWTNLLP